MGNPKKDVNSEGSKELVTKSATALSNVESVIIGSIDIGADIGKGSEGAGAEAFAIPFIQVLQKMSPVVDPDDPKYIKDAKAGMLIDSVTREIFDGKKGLQIVPAAFKRSFIKWGGRESAESGFMGEFTPEDINAKIENGEIVALEGRLYEPDENGKVDPKKSPYFADTRSHYVVVVKENGEYSQAVISLASSQVKASRMLMTSLKQKKVKHGDSMITPPSFLNIVRFTTIGQSNSQGSWSGCQFALEGLVTDINIYNEAREMNAAFAKGEVKVDYSKADYAHTGDDGGDKPQDAEEF